MSEEDILTEDQAISIANFLIKDKIRYLGKEEGLYRKIQWAAARLKIIDEDPTDIYQYNPKILSNNDFLSVIDKIWDFLIKGYVAPGKDRNNPWLPHIHLTEEGKKYFENKNFD